MRPRSLLARFAVLSAALIILLGAVLAVIVFQVVRRAHLDSAAQGTAVATTFAVQTWLEPGDLNQPLPARRTRELDERLAPVAASSGIARLKIWNARGELVYSDQATRRAQGPASAPASAELARALAGEVAAEVITAPTDPSNAVLLDQEGSLLEVYVPVRFAGDQRPAGALEVYLPYRATAQASAADTRTIALVLLAGLTLLYLALFRTVAGASRTLRRQAAENAHQALHDGLTGLPNWRLLRDRAEQALRTSDRRLGPAALMLIDLDRFKEVNDTLGHSQGDRLLAEVGERLRRLLREEDTVARMGGDEFAVLLPSVRDIGYAAALAHKVRDALSRPIHLDELPVSVEASVGIAVYPDHGSTADELLQRADVAMYVAKETHAGYTVYDRSLDQHTPRRLALLGELNQALERGELLLHYQPKVELASGRVPGVEALVRWQHPTYGLLAPEEFMPLAERTGLIGPITSYVLAAALDQCDRWRRTGRNLTVAVNVSSRSLLDVDFPRQVHDLLSRHGVAPALLELEITESSLMTDPVRARDVLGRLHAMGSLLSVDDFGTGYSALAYLKALPVHTLKVDRSFVTAMTTSASDAVIVRSTVELGRNLGLVVVAEGVEDAAAVRALAGLGCDQGQGSHFSPPVPAPDLEAWLDAVPNRSVRPH